MDAFSLFIGLGLGLALGGAAVWLARKGRLAALSDRLAQTEAALETARADLAVETEAAAELKARIARLETALEHERDSAQEKLALLEEAKTALADQFKALSADALADSSRSFLELAKATLEKFQAEAKGDLAQRQQAIDGLVKPIKETLERFKTQIAEMESARRQAYGSLSEQVKALIASENQLRAETDNLVKALRRPQVRGRWGEVQLRRVVEFAGMVAHCDFVEQETVPGGDGRQQRPDMIIRLPGGKIVVVDAKTPIEAYLAAVEAEDEAARQSFMRDHVRQIRAQMTNLGKKNYWDQFEATPDFVVMFLPGDAILNAALEQEPGLLEEGYNLGVMLTTPTTLIALLRSVAYDWRTENLVANTQEIRRLGRDLYERICTMTDHFAGVGKSLDRAVSAYNKAVGSLEGRVLSGARRFLELGVDSAKKLPEPVSVERSPRQIQAPELVNPLIENDDRDED